MNIVMFYKLIIRCYQYLSSFDKTKLTYKTVGVQET